MSDAELLAPVTTPEAPPADPPAPLVAEPQTPEQEDAALDKLIEDQAIDIPGDTDRLVPLSAVTTVRAKLSAANKELAAAKAGSTKATELEGQIAQLREQLNQALPYAQAYQAALQAPPAEPAGPTPEQKAALEEIARDYDFYKPDGALDLDRATRHQARIRKDAEAIAQQTIAPYQQQTVADRSSAFLASAKLTKAPNGQQPDPEILDAVWARCEPSLTATKAGAIQAWNIALGYSVATGKAVTAQAAPAAKTELPPPLLTERAGGREVAGPTLTDDDRKMARQLGVSDKDYAAELATMPQGWGKR